MVVPRVSFAATRADHGAVTCVAPSACATRAASPASASASQTQVQHAELYLKVLIGGLQSEKVPQEVKGTLVGCIYNHSLGELTANLDKLISENADKIHRDKPNELLEGMAALCGYKPSAGAKPAAPATGR